MNFVRLATPLFKAAQVTKEEIRKSGPGKLPIRSAAKTYDRQPQPVRVLIPVLAQNIDTSHDHVPPFHDTDRVGNTPRVAINGIKILGVEGNPPEIITATCAEALDGARGIRFVDLDQLGIANRLTVDLDAAVAMVVQATVGTSHGVDDVGIKGIGPSPGIALPMRNPGSIGAEEVNGSGWLVEVVDECTPADLLLLADVVVAAESFFVEVVDIRPAGDIQRAVFVHRVGGHQACKRHRGGSKGSGVDEVVLIVSPGCDGSERGTALGITLIRV